MDNSCPKPCHNDGNTHKCNHCGIKCTSDDCDKSNCEIFGSNGHKHLVCMCPKTSCKCLGREPTKQEYMEHLVTIYSIEIENIGKKI